MADSTSSTEIQDKITDVYIPFLKKCITHMEKGKVKDSDQSKLKKLKYVYTTFTEADIEEKIQVYNAWEGMLNRWHKKYKDITKKNTSSSSSLNVSEDSQSESSVTSNPKSESKASCSETNSNMPFSIVSVVSVSNPNQSNVNKQFSEKRDGVYFQDEIEIEPSDSSTTDSILPGATDGQGEKWKSVQIKKEKIDPASKTQANNFPGMQVAATYGQPQVTYANQPATTFPQSTQASYGLQYKHAAPAATPSVTAITMQPVKETLTTKMLNARKAQQEANNKEGGDGTPQKEVTFVCASCQFRTLDETEFMKHARTDHRTDLSLWCKQCGKCFSNAGVLVAHIKEDNCQKEEMIYRCGVKECTFETPSGQTFVHHLRHCHKGSPFIFCIHCQKIFTLPHCLILHMQNECPFKDKNRRFPGQTPPAAAAVASPVPTPPVPKPIIVERQPVVVPVVPKPVVTSPSSNALTSVFQSVLHVPSRGRAAAASAKKAMRGGRGRGRGRGSRGTFTDSSDSDDPDDPNWRPDESLSQQPLRRSARWAKKLCDVANPETYEPEAMKSYGKSKVLTEQPGETFFHCPCCEFSALFRSLLEDHYVTNHKNQKKNSCLVCNVKFESVKLFIEHFTIHEKEKKEGKTNEPPVEESNVPEKTSIAEKVPELNPTNVNVENVPANYGLVVQTETNDSVVKIPYQTAIHEKLQKEAKLKSFDELKSPNDVLKMKTEIKLKHFYKCVLYNCTFTTDDKGFYSSHMKEQHEGKRLHCPFCLKEFYVGSILSDHMLQDHGRRRFQCSLCFYRAYSKPHVQIHIKNVHVGENASVYSCTSHIPSDFNVNDDEKSKENESTLATTWPYVCAIGDCKFQTYDPKEFKKHNDMTHRAVTVFFCYYCKVDFISFKRLMSHYHLHGINNFQCTYCVHGSDTREEILIHLCNCHADKPFKVHVRASQAADTAGKKNLSFEITPSPSVNQISLGASSDSGMPNLTAEISTIKKNAGSELSLRSTGTLKIKEEVINEGDVKKYPKEILCLQKDFYCRMPRCEEQVSDVNSYLKHLKHYHSAVNFLCPYCPVVVENLVEFTNHLLCHGPNLYACSYNECLWHHWQKESLIDHMEKAHNTKDAFLIMIRQQISRGDVMQLGSIEIEPFSSNFPSIGSSKHSFVCLFCNFKSSEKVGMKNHIYQELVYKRFQCNLCKIKCYSRKEICGHFSSLHSGHNIKCTIDSNHETEFLVKNYLSSKIQDIVMEHFNLEGIPSATSSGSFCFPSHYSCESCSASFYRMREYQSHVFYCFHKDYFPQICNYCESKCLDLASMKCHTNDKHNGKPINFSTYQNILLEDQIGKKIRNLRFKTLKDIMNSLLDKKTKSLIDVAKLWKVESKSYKCGYCPFVDSFRSNIEKHLVGSHKDQPVKVEKIVSDWSSQVAKANNSEEENSNDGSRQSNIQLQYMCGLCSKRTATLDDLEDHVEGHQSMQNEKDFTYFYFPDLHFDYSESDTECYRCAYCSVSRENLYHLRRHCNNLHSAVPFKVSGQKSFKEKKSLIKCLYCSFKSASCETILLHSNINHLNMPLQVFPEASNKQGQKRKCDSPLSNDGTSGPSASKQSKTDTSKFCCTYCGESFTEFMKLLSHNKSSHPNLPAKYEKVSNLSSGSAGIRLLQCEFCPFLGERSLLEDHLSLKHKSRVSCGHCGKQFDYAIKIRAHNRKEHPNVPIKIVRPVVQKTAKPVVADSEDSTCSEGSATSRRFISHPSGMPSNAREAGISHYGLKPEPVDLHNITVIMDTAGSRESAKLPVVYLCELFKMFPKVLVSDIRKNNH